MGARESCGYAGPAAWSGIHLWPARSRLRTAAATRVRLGRALLAISSPEMKFGAVGVRSNQHPCSQKRLLLRLVNQSPALDRSDSAAGPVELQTRWVAVRQVLNVGVGVVDLFDAQGSRATNTGERHAAANVEPSRTQRLMLVPMAVPAMRATRGRRHRVGCPVMPPSRKADRLGKAAPAPWIRDTDGQS